MRELETIMAPGAVDKRGSDYAEPPFQIVVDGVPTMIRQTDTMMVGRMVREESDLDIGITMSITRGGVGDGMVHFMDAAEARQLADALLTAAERKEAEDDRRR